MNRMEMRGCEKEEGGERDERWLQPWKETDKGRGEEKDKS